MAKHDAIDWTEELENKVLDSVKQGFSLREIGKECGFSASRIVEYALDNASFAERYTRAKRIKAAVRFDDLAAVQEPRTGKWGIDVGWVNWQRYLLEKEKYQLSILDRAEYGERTELAGPNGAPLQLIISVPVPKRDELPTIDQKLLDK